MVKILPKHKFEVWDSAEQAGNDAKRWATTGKLKVDAVTVVPVQCEDARCFAVQVDGQLYGRKGVNADPLRSVQQEINIAAGVSMRHFEIARRLIANHESLLKLAQWDDGRTPAPQAQLVPPFRIKLVGDTAKVEQAAKDLEGVDGTEFADSSIEFHRDFEHITRESFETADECQLVVSLFCEGYPTMQPSDFEITDSTGQKVPAPQLAEQLRLF